MDSLTLKQTFDILPGGLLVTDTQSRVLYASSALERRTGFSVAEIIGKKPGELWGGKMGKPFYQSLWQTIGTDSRPFVAEVRNTKKNGTKHDEHIFIVPIRDGTGVTQYFAEVHPEFSNREQEITFGREFLARADTMVQDSSLFSWVFQNLGKKRDGTVVTAQPQFFARAHSQDAASFVRETLVRPMEKMFVRRKEDALLITLAQESPEMFSQLYEKYAVPVREYFSRRLRGDRVLSEDLTQEVFIRAFHYLPQFRLANASYYTYLLRVAHSVLVNQYRKERIETVTLSGREESIPMDEPRLLPDMEELLGSFSETERQAMLLKYRDGYKVRAIAKLLGKTENAIKLILSRTRKKLKKSLE